MRKPYCISPAGPLLVCALELMSIRHVCGGFIAPHASPLPAGTTIKLPDESTAGASPDRGSSGQRRRIGDKISLATAGAGGEFRSMSGGDFLKNARRW
jgi:hypothetical protein